VHHEAALDLGRTPSPQRVEPLPAPSRDLAVARDLRRPEVRDELLGVGRLVWTGGVVDVEFRIAPVRILFVGY